MLGWDENRLSEVRAVGYSYYVCVALSSRARDMTSDQLPLPSTARLVSVQHRDPQTAFRHLAEHRDVKLNCFGTVTSERRTRTPARGPAILYLKSRHNLMCGSSHLLIATPSHSSKLEHYLIWQLKACFCCLKKSGRARWRTSWNLALLCRLSTSYETKTCTTR